MRKKQSDSSLTSLIGEQRSLIPAYFSHSYRLPDRDVNEFFWRLLWKQGLTITVDPKSSTLSVPYLERLMKRSTCFVAVVTLRPEQPVLRCSPYIVFEYGLAVQAQKPRLLFVEDDVGGSFFSEHDRTCDFSRASLADPRHIATFEEKITGLLEECRVDRRTGPSRRGKAGIFLSAYRGGDEQRQAALKHIKDALSRFGFIPEEVPTDFESDFRLALKLDSFDFVVIDVAPQAPEAWLYPYVHGRFVPMVKLFYLPVADRSKISLSPLITGQLIKGVGESDNSVIFWRDKTELIERFEDQLNKFENRRVQFNIFEKGLGYFRSLGRSDQEVFISCANDASELSSSLSVRLSTENIKNFHYKASNPIELDSEWSALFLDHLEKSQIFLALITKGYSKSEWCKKEFQLASKMRTEGRLKLIPYFLEEVRGFRVGTQGRDLTGLSKEDQISQIVNDLDSLLTLKQPEPVRDKPRMSKGSRDLGVDIAIITVLPEEYQAILRHLENRQTASITRTAPNLYAWELGEIQSPHHSLPFKVVLAMTGRSGTIPGFQTTLSTVERWRPRFVLFVGIAGGRNFDQLSKGDVVVSDVIWQYEYGKLADSGYEPRQDRTFQTAISLLTAAKKLDLTDPDWKNSIAAPLPEGNREPEVKIGPVASGDKVIDNVEDPFFVKVIQKWPKLLAIEMEGAGAASAIMALGEKEINAGFTMIRGISDVPSGPQNGASDHPFVPSRQTTERDNWKRYAADVAACFTVHLIRRQWPVPPNGKNNPLRHTITTKGR